MQKITFHNNNNDLECSFATDNRTQFLAAFDGNSLGADFTTFKPVAFDGTRTLAHTLGARTIPFTAQWCGLSVTDGTFAGAYHERYDRNAALEEWEKLQFTFNPGDKGVLTWTNGKQTRTINCYAEETPPLKEITRGMFAADFKLIADYPLWRGDTLHSATFSGTEYKAEAVIVTNDCPIFVPPLIVIDGVSRESGQTATVIRSNRAGKSYGTKSIGINTSVCSESMGKIYIDCAEMLCYQNAPTGSKYNRNNALSPYSEFFSLYPGDNTIVLTMNTASDQPPITIEFEWYDHYLGVTR